MKVSSAALVTLFASISNASAFSVAPTGLSSTRTVSPLRMESSPSETVPNVEDGAAAAGLEAAELPPPPKKVDIFEKPKELPGVVAPLGFFDPLDFASRADGPTMRRYREAELTHGRVGMLAVLGFLAGEFVEGSSFLWNAEITGPAITHLEQVPSPFWVLLTVGIGASESERLNIGWVDPADVKYSQPGLLREDYTPGDIGFDPFGLKPTDPEGLKNMQTKELQNGRLAMIAAAGCLAQELVNGKGILETLGIDAHL